MVSEAGGGDVRMELVRCDANCAGEWEVSLRNVMVLTFFGLGCGMWMSKVMARWSEMERLWLEILEMVMFVEQTGSRIWPCL